MHGARTTACLPTYVHQVIDHAQSYVEGNVHTNTIENFWSLLKRGLKGTYIAIEPFHLFRYLDEQAFRYNERKNDDGGRFLEVLNGLTGRRLTYQKVTGKDETDPAGKRGRVRVRVSSSTLDPRASVPLQLRFPFSVQQRSRG
jgi:ISXO2-like transposase domain